MVQIGFRLLTRGDFPRLAQWLGAPHVARWWDERSDLEYLEAHFGPGIDGTEPVTLYVIELDGEAAGLIQAYQVSDFPEWREYDGEVAGLETAAGIDFLLGRVRDTGKGIGTRVLRDVLAVVFEKYPEVDAVLADPDQANVGSWRALEKAGFERVWAGQLASQDEPSFLYRYARQ